MSFFKSLFKGFRWSLYISKGPDNVLYRASHDDVSNLLAYISVHYADGGELNKDWCLYLNFNWEQKMFLLEPEDFYTDKASALEIKDSLKTKLFSVDPGWDSVIDMSDPVCQTRDGKDIPFGGAADLDDFRDKLLKEYTTGEKQDFDSPQSFISLLIKIFS